MNKQQKAKISQQYLKLTVRFENSLRRKVVKILNNYYRKYASRYAGASTYVSDLDEKLFIDINKTLNEHYRQVMPSVSNFALQFINKITKASILDEVQALVSHYIASKGLKSALNITETTKKRARKIIDEGVLLGEGINEVAKKLQAIRVLNGARAVVIARTETHAASNFANYETAKVASQKFDVSLQKEWIPVFDARTRDTHAEMINHPAIDLDDYFDVGGFKAKHPLDSDLPPEEAINCRCVLAFVEKTFDIR